MIFSQSLLKMFLLTLAVNAECDVNWLSAQNLSDWQAVSDQSKTFASCDLSEDTVSFDLKQLLPDVTCIKRVHVQTNQKEVSINNPSDSITIEDVFEPNCTREETVKITVEDLQGRRLALNRTFDPVDCFGNESVTFRVGPKEKVIIRESGDLT